MYYTYVLEVGETDKKLYTGSTNDLKRRLLEHKRGIVRFTKKRPFKLIYYEACLNESSARKREKYLKTAWGKRYLRCRLYEK